MPIQQLLIRNRGLLVDMPPPGVTLKLTNRTGLTRVNFSTGYVTLLRNGVIAFSTFGNPQGLVISDEWVDTGRSSTVGDDFQVRFNKSGSWLRLNTTRAITRTSAGTIIVEIRRYLGTYGTILAEGTMTFN